VSRKKAEDRAVLRNLGDGLVLRRSTRADAKALAEYNAAVLGPNDERLRGWIHDLMKGNHPTFGPGDFTFVEDTKTGGIVSSLNLISQRWSYAGIGFGVGRPEVVSTHPDYRKRGLVRAQFEAIHEWSAQRGKLMTAVTGIPYFYRQFGYEMTVELGGGKACPIPNVPGLKRGQKEPYRVRRADEPDLPFMARLYKESRKRYLLSSVRDRAMWCYDLNGRNRKSSEARELRIVETAAGRRIGLLVHPPRISGDSMPAGVYELKHGEPWLKATPSVLRYLKKKGEVYAKKGKTTLRSITFRLGSEHPLYEMIPDKLVAVRKPYAWYVRVPDLPRFLRHISPVLEQRLAGSVLVGHTGEIKISFYRDGLRLVFRKGRVTKVEPWAPTPGDGGHAGFPHLTFLQLLFGHRTLDELNNVFPDCGAHGDGVRALLTTLFPKQASSVWPVS